jgi:3-carboxy-cis,cis-muconate cycloisomerase
MVARTRFQQATPTTFGLKCANWLAPVLRGLERLPGVRARSLVVQFGGASGNLAALRGRGIAVMDALADELQLGRAVPWHTQRDGIAELAAWLATVAGPLGKMGVDLIALSRTEVGEVTPGSGGGSSTMPNKANPVGPEMLVALARFASAQTASVLDAQVQEHERDGTTWTLEWLSLPQLAVATATALRHAIAIAENLEVNADRMRSNIDASGGLVLAEAASFALAEHLPRPQAQALVKAACQDAMRDGRHLMDVLAERTDTDIDWTAVADPAAYIGETDALIDRILATVQAVQRYRVGPT